MLENSGILKYINQAQKNLEKINISTLGQKQI